MVKVTALVNKHIPPGNKPLSLFFDAFVYLVQVIRDKVAVFFFSEIKAVCLVAADVKILGIGKKGKELVTDF